MTKNQYKKLFSQSDWTIESLQIIFDLLDKKSKEWLKLDCYPNQFEIVSADQLLNLYSSIGLPTNYPHWKFGKDYMINHNKYLNGRMGLSYEMIINCLSSDSIIDIENYGIAKLEDLEIGQNIWNGNEYVKVISKIKSNQTSGLKITIRNDHDILNPQKVYSIKCTKEHYFPVFNQGYVTLSKAEELGNLDYLFINTRMYDRWMMIPQEIIKIEEVNDLVFYDIEVDSSDHLFVANDILTHNCNPCISYNIEENDLCLMTLVYAHAAGGHNHFFKNNYMFRDWTQADSIIDYMKFARNFILECEKKYGPDEVEEFLDCCHSIQNYGVDVYNHPRFSLQKEQQRIQNTLKWEEENFDAVLDRGKKQKEYKDYDELDLDLLQTALKEPQENILYFLEKFTPKLPKWKRELIRIVRKVAQYFFPQSSTKVANEGTATFVHHYMINRLYDEGYLPDSFMLEFFKHHTNVVFQPTFDKPYFSGINPYTLGFNIFADLKRICEHPTDEDRKFFPDLCGKDWLEEFHYAVKNFRDDSFIQQYLSPKVIRDMKLFSYYDDSDENYYTISNIHDEKGYLKIREILAKQYNRSSYIPNISVTSYDELDQILMLEYHVKDDIELNEEDRDLTLDNIEAIWGGTIDIKYYIKGKEIEK